MITYQDVPKFSQDKTQSMEGTLTEQETFMFWKKWKMIKAQGLTDLQQSFLKIFWQEIGCFVTRAIDYSYEHKMFSEQNKSRETKTILKELETF